MFVNRVVGLVHTSRTRIVTNVWLTVLITNNQTEYMNVCPYISYCDHTLGLFLSCLSHDGFRVIWRMFCISLVGFWHTNHVRLTLLQTSYTTYSQQISLIPVDKSFIHIFPVFQIPVFSFQSHYLFFNDFLPVYARDFTRICPSCSLISPYQSTCSDPVPS